VPYFPILLGHDPNNLELYLMIATCLYYLMIATCLYYLKIPNLWVGFLELSFLNHVLLMSYYMYT
ncbi:hypothetical protein ACJX0J_040448, partial [Zea mays]